jgi:hypothetical protein
MLPPECALHSRPYAGLSLQELFREAFKLLEMSCATEIPKANLQEAQTIDPQPDGKDAVGAIFGATRFFLDVFCRSP